MKIFQLTIVCLTVYAVLLSGEESPCENLINQKGANGSDVVLAVIARIESLNIFNDSDHRFLRRLAYVGTKDGTIYGDVEDMKNGGGIWTFDSEKLESMQNATKNSTETIGRLLSNVNYLIKNRLGIDLFDDKFEMEDVANPLYCGIATRFYLYYLMVAEGVSIPSVTDLTGQAYFWFEHFDIIERQFCLEEYFRDEVKQLEKEEGWWINADILFVLDLSNSIKLEDFEKMKDFQLAFVEKMKIGKNHNQVGTIIFKENAITVFNLNNHTDKQSIVMGINSTRHNELGLTNIQDALCHLNNSFGEDNGGRPASSGVFRIAFIMTDGVSNQHHSSCNWSNIEEAANEIHERLSPILLYVIGVGAPEELNEVELKTIASSGCYTRIDSFAFLENVQTMIANDLADGASARVDVNEEMNCTLSMNEIYRYNLQIESAIMVNICVSAGGHVEMYGSTFIPNPNSALYDYYLNLNYEYYTDDTSEVCGSAVIDLQRELTCSSTESKGSRRRSISDRTTVYFSIVGKAKTNSFTVTMNDTYISDDKLSQEENTAGEKDDDWIIAAGTSSTLLLIILAGILIAAICGCSVYLYKKKKKVQDEDDYKLLPQSPEHTQY